MDSEDEPKADQATKDEGRLAKKLRQEEAREWSCTCLGIFPFSFERIDIDETNTLYKWSCGLEYRHHCANNETNTLIYDKARHYID